MKPEEFRLDYSLCASEKQEPRLVVHEFSTPARISHDLTQSTDLIQVLDLESDLHYTPLISTRITHLFDNAMNEDSILAQQTKHLDMNIFYLKFVHGFTYYTSHESLFPHSPIPFLRRHTALPTTNPNPREDPGAKQCKRNDTKIQTRLFAPAEGTAIIALGGKCELLSIDLFIGQVVREEQDRKFRCRECEKLFKGEEFCKRHVLSKHPELVEGVKHDLQFFNAYVRYNINNTY